MSRAVSFHFPPLVLGKSLAHFIPGFLTLEDVGARPLFGVSCDIHALWVSGVVSAQCIPRLLECVVLSFFPQIPGLVLMACFSTTGDHQRWHRCH